MADRTSCPCDCGRCPRLDQARARRAARETPQRLTAPAHRILFPFIGDTVSYTTLDAGLRLARAEGATLVPAYVATVPLHLALEAPLPQECERAIPLLEAIEQRAARLGVPVDSRVEVGRTARHALRQLIEQEAFDRLVVPAATHTSEGFSAEDIAWLLEHAAGEIVVLRPQDENGREQSCGTRALPDVSAPTPLR